jgi:predicted neuraminidase
MKIISRPEISAHCSTICPHKDGVLTAYYNGPECTDTQAVNIEYSDKDIPILKLPRKTGNCVLIPMNSKNACLIFSLFEDNDGIEEPKSPVARWRFCSNWKLIVSVSNGKITTSKPERFETEYNVGHLVRCNPIHWKGLWYLPIYREHDVYGEIMTSIDGYKWKSLSKIGDNINRTSGKFGKGVLIQPTIWADNTKIYSLSRDVSNNRKAWYSESSDQGKTWSKPISSNISNDNNSIVAIHMNISEPLIVWNFGFGRSSLVLGKYKNLNGIPLYQLNKGHASYPNYCFDSSNNLQIVHTDQSQIVRHVIDRRQVDKFLV